MTNKPIDLATSQAEPQKRACSECRHIYRAKISSDAVCGATGRDLIFERMSDVAACGRRGHLWQPRPPRLGFFAWLRVLFFGERK
jgi:hypothetical protein